MGCNKTRGLKRKLPLFSSSLVIIWLLAVTIDLSQGQTPLNEIYALEDLYQATLGSFWNNCDRWLINDPCGNDWYGVQCEQETGGNATHVVSLLLSQNILRGTIPYSIEGLSLLTMLSLSDNYLTDILPPSLGKLTFLATLKLFNNVLTGPLPSSFSELKSLSSFEAGGNDFKGSLEVFSNTTSLKFLSLRVNSFTSLSDLSKLTDLQYLDLSYNDFSGSLVADMLPPNIFSLDISGNDWEGSPPNLTSFALETIVSSSVLFTGSDVLELYCQPLLKSLTMTYATELSGFPRFPPACSSLLKLNMKSSSLGGPFPSGLANLPFLTDLNLGGCNLYGTYPDDLFSLSYLRYLRMPTNALSGNISRFFELPSLEILHVELNRLYGTLPRNDEVDWRMSRIVEFHAVSNSIENGLPSDIFRITTLSQLDVSYNPLGGTLPEIPLSSPMSRLSLSQAEFEGTIPRNWTELSLLLELTLDANSLTGTLPAFPRNSILEILIVDDNQLSGTLCDQLPIVLKEFRAKGNSFSGQICDDVFPPLLEDVVLANNDFFGTLPTSLPSSGALQFVDFSGNSFVGTIPWGLFEIYPMQLLKFDNNMLSGSLPTEVRGLDKISTINLSNNRLSGSVPYFDCPELTKLILGNNSFSGELVLAESITLLRVLDIRNNQLEGELGDSWGGLGYLEEVYLNNNSFSGAFPILRGLQIDFPTRRVILDLATLDASYNQFTSLSGAFAAATLLNYLNFRGNKLSSVSASDFGSPGRIQVFDMTQNMISSSGSELLKSLTGAYYISLYQNNFYGTLPANPISNNLEMFYVDYNHFHGEPPGWLCDLADFGISYNIFTCILPPCCLAGDAIADVCIGCIEPPPTLLETTQGVVYTAVGVLLALIIAAGVVVVLARTYGKRVLVATGYGTFGSHSSLYLDDIEIGSKVGSGYAGTVYRGKWDGTTTVALKSIGEGGKAQGGTFEREASLLLSARHPNVVQLLGLYKKDNEKYIVTEMMEKGGLDEVLRREWVSHRALANVVKQVSAGLNFLHRLGVIHRDVAARNILLKEERASYTAKIGDFGSAQAVGPFGTVVGTDQSSAVVPLRWSAKEVLEEFIFSHKSDIYSFGVTVWEIFNGAKTPWPGMSNAEVLQAITRGDVIERCQTSPLFYTDVVCPCMNLDPERRPSARELYTFISEMPEPTANVPSSSDLEPVLVAAAPPTEDDSTSSETYIYVSKVL